MKKQQVMVYPPLAVPQQPDQQQEIQIARLTQLLTRPNLDNNIRAKMLRDRGNAYDSVGLRDLAYLDFTQSLHLNPIQPNVFNLLGVYYTQIGVFDEAYDAFDSALDLDPSNLYAERNRAIALYYGGRNDLAENDIKDFYQKNPSDPYRVLWLYIIEAKQHPQQAKAQLTKRYHQSHAKTWGWTLVALMLKDISDQDAFNSIVQTMSKNDELAQHLTEMYFYLAKRNQIAGDMTHAISFYKLATLFNVYDYIEHRYAFIELAQISDKIYHDRLEQISDTKVKSK